jgi:hypothetical protein
LDDLLGYLVIRGQTTGRRVDRVDVTVIDLRQRSLRPAHDFVDEIVVAGLMVLCHRYDPSPSFGFGRGCAGPGARSFVVRGRRAR